MLKITYLLFIVALVLQVSRAWDEGNNEEEQLAAARQQSDEYFANAFGYTSNPWDSAYYQPSAPDNFNSLHGRNPVIRTSVHPFSKYFVTNLVKTENSEEEDNQPEGRFALGGLGANLINTGLFNNRFTPANTWRPFANLANRIPVSYNPNYDNPLDTFDACTSPSGDAGICAPGNICSLFGGRPSGSCILGKVCCINSISTCGGTVTLNNTFWQSPSRAVSAPSTCALTVRLNTKLVEQLKRPICQVRLDFVSFTTAQPTVGTCTVDTFIVGGSTSVVPVICGDNSGQHMYLDVPSSAITPTNVQLMFNFGTATATRSWNIKIAMLPCGASYLAPSDCLQYFTAASGRVKSFNWQDVAGMTTRQLNNQNYNICFRTELVSSQRATQMCLSICAVANGGDAFSITTPTDVAAAVAAVVTATTNLANAQTTLTNAQATLATAQTTLANAQTALTTAKDKIAPTQATLTDAKDALATAQETVPVAEAALTKAQGALTNAQTDLGTAQETLTTARTALTKAQIDLAAAKAIFPPDYAAVAAAQADLATAQTTVYDKKAAVDRAQAAANTAQTDVNNAQTTLTNAQTAVTDAQTTVDTAQLAADNAQTAVTDAQTAVDTAQKNVNKAQVAVTDAQTAVTTAQAALTAAQTAAANAVASAAALSGVGTSAIVNGVNTATCLYDYLLIAGARDSTNVVADRFCGNALNPAITPVATSVPVCTPIKPFRMTFQTDNTEGSVAAGANILPAPADTANTGFCLDYQEK